MADSNYGNTLYSKFSNGLGTPLTNLNIIDTLNFGGAGAWLRYQLAWGNIETTTTANISNPSNYTYNWNCLDSVCYACQQAGVNLLFVLQQAPHGGNGQASPGLNRLRIDANGNDVGYGGTNALYASPADFKYFAQQVATRYCGSYTDPNTGLVRYIPGLQLGNEEYDTKPTNIHSWLPGGRDDQGKRLGEMLNQAASAVKTIYAAASTTVKLGINAIRRVPDPNYTRTHCIVWLSNVMNTIGSNAQYIDFTDFHNYRQDPTLGNNNPRAQDPSWDYPQTPANGWPYGADVPSIATRLTDMLTVLTTAGYGPSNSHPIQVWCCETGWALFDDGTSNENPIIYVSQGVCSQYYQIAADQMRLNGGSKIMYYTMDSTKKMHNYSTPYQTQDVNGNTISITQWCDDKDTIISLPVGSSTPTYYQPYNDMKSTNPTGYVATYPTWTGGSSGGGGGTGGTSGSNIIVANDSFIRANQTGWGLASDTTDTWVQTLGTATPSIVSNKGQVTGATGANNILLGTGMLINGDFKVRFSVSTTGSLAGLVFRRIDANNQMRVEVGNNIIRFKKTVAGTATVLTPNNTTITIANSTKYWIHVNVSGTTYNVNVWADGTTEPAGWMITDTDGSITSAGQFGLHANPATSGSTVLFDQYSATTTTNTYYVSPTGSDSNTGTSANPWQTLTKVNAAMQAGDSVFFSNGNYTGGVTLTTSGTFSAPISLTATNTHLATIIEPGGAGIGTFLLNVSADHIILTGFEVTGPDAQYGIQVINNYDTVQECYCHDICNTLILTSPQEGYGIGVPGITGYTNAGTNIEGNLIARIGKKNASGIIQSKTNQHGIYVMTNSSASTGFVQNNLIILSAGFGIAMYHNPQYWVVTNNTLINNTYGGLQCYGDTANGYLADYNIIQNNIFMESGNTGYYPAIQSSSDQCGFHTVFRTNLAFHPKHKAIYDFTPANANPLQTASNLPNANPLFVNYINDGTGDYHLSPSGSPAIDTGTAQFAPDEDYDGNSRPQGAGFDVGCYESTPSLIVTIGGVGVLFDEDSFTLSTKVNERWRCQLYVLDYTGTQFYQYGEKIQVIDSQRGTLFTGYLMTDTQDKTNVYGSSAIIHQIDSVDPRHLADKRTSNRLYTVPYYAGKIVVDMVHDVLKSEGVVAYYAQHTDQLASDFGQGTLTNVVATNNLGGDLELATLANVSQVINTNSDWHAGTISNLLISGGDVSLYIYEDSWNTGSTANQTLWGQGNPKQFIDKSGYYDLTCQSVSNVFGGETRARLDWAGNWTNGSIQVDLYVNDSNLHSVVYRTPNWDNIDGHWCYAVEFSTTLIRLQKGTNGGAGTITTLATSSVNLGTGWYTLRVDFNGNAHTVSINGQSYLNANDTTSPYNFAGYVGLRNRNLNTSVGNVVTMQFRNFNVSPAFSGTWQSTPAVSLSSISNIVNSTITWAETVASRINTSGSSGSGSSTNSPATVTIQASTDGGTTFTQVQSGGPLPLTPGTSGSGKSVVIKAALSTTDLNYNPNLVDIEWVVTSGYTASGNRTSVPPTTLATDTFIRANQSGWGTSSGGQNWYLDQGNGTLAIASNEGTVTGLGTLNFMRPGKKYASDVNAVVRFALGNQLDSAGILLRYTDTNNFYRCTFGNGLFFLEKYVGGNQTTLIQQTFTQSAGTYYWMRFQIQDNVLSARQWLDGSTEPTLWALNIIDSDITSGLYGLYAAPSSSAAVSFDHLTIISAGVTPGLDLTPVGRVGSTYIGWNATIPQYTTLGVDVSTDGGSTWIDVSDQNGGPLPNITTQPDPTVEGFSYDDSASYTSTSGTNGTGANWNYDLVNDRMIATGGIQAIYAYNAISTVNIELYADMDYSDSGGLVWCYSDSNDYYALVVGDNQSQSAPGTLTLYKSQPVAYSTAILTDTPQAYYRFDEASGTTTTDSSTYARNATYSGTGVSYNQIGAITTTSDTCVLLDGVAGCVTCPTSVKPDSYSAFSFEIWVNLSTTSFGSGVRIATNATTTTNNKGFTLYFTASAASLNFAVGNGTTYAQATYTGTFTTNTWYHIVGTYDGAHVTLYLNGNSVAQASLTGTIAAGTNAVTIGCNVGASGFFSGDIDEAAFYNFALSYGRIITHYNYGSGQSDRNTTLLAQTSINFVRQTFHRVRAKSLNGTMAIHFDDTLAISYIDNSPLPPGNPGLFQDSTSQYALRAFGGPALYDNGALTARFYQLWMQPIGDDVTGMIIHTRLRLATTNSAYTPQVESLTIAAYGPQIDDGTLIPSADYRYTFVSKNIDDLAKQSDYQWWIDPTYIIYFNHRQAQPAYWIPQSNNLGLPSDIVLDSNLAVEVHGDLYRNRQVLTGVTNTATFVDNFIGDGKQTSFTLRYPVSTGSKPIVLVTVDNIPQSVGLKGTTGSNWYYAEGDPVLAQDANGAVLGITDTMVVTYTGTFIDTVVVDNTSAQQALAQLEDGTGIVEAVEDVSKPGMFYDAAVTYANQLLARYCNTGRTITFTTNRDGLQVGQAINVYIPEENLPLVPLLITDIEITFHSLPNNTRLFQYVVTASELAPRGSWQKLMASGLLSVAEVS